MTKLKVARVINDRELAITGGSDAGVQVGDVLMVLGKPVQILDPGSQEPLGEVATSKAVVRVYEVQERFCLARTFRQKRVNVGGDGLAGAGLGRFFEPPKYETRTETLRRNPELGLDIDEDEAVVQVGDSVEAFSGETDDIPSSTVWR